MTVRRSNLTLAMMVAALADLVLPAGAPPEHAPQPAGRSRYLPHQNVRECARRIGGPVWLDYRNARRKARGLPPLTH